jgi:MFS family permease
VIVLASIIPAVLAVVILAIGARETAQPRAADAKLPRFSLKGMDQQFRAFLGVMVVFTLGNSSDSFIILLGQERGLSLLQIMGMLLTFNAVYTLLAGPAGMLSDRLGRKVLILTGWVFYGLIYLGLAFSTTGAQVWLLFGLYGIYYAMTEGAAKAFVADLVPQEQRGTAYGMFNAAIGLTALPASVIAGVLWQGIGEWPGFGPSAPFIFGAIMALLAGLLMKTQVRQPGISK